MLHVCECCAVIAAVLRVITKSLKLRYSLCLLVVATVSRNTICMSKQSVVYVPGWNVLMDYSLRLQISHPSPDGKIILSEMIKNLKKEKDLKKKKKKKTPWWICECASLKLFFFCRFLQRTTPHPFQTLCRWMESSGAVSSGSGVYIDDCREITENTKNTDLVSIINSV